MERLMEFPENAQYAPKEETSITSIAKNTTVALLELMVNPHWHLQRVIKKEMAWLDIRLLTRTA